MHATSTYRFLTTQHERLCCMKKIFALLLVYAALAIQPAYTRQKLDWICKNNLFSINYSKKESLGTHKATFAACAVAGTVALIGSAIALIHYIYRFNLGDAQDLIKTANQYKIETEGHYAQEIALLKADSEQERIEKIRAIITKIRTSTPYFEYARKASKSLKECNKLLKKIHNGIPKLEAQYQKLQTHAHQYDPLKLANEIDQTEKALETLKNLEDTLSVLANHISDLYLLCTHTEEYKSEVQMIQLAAIHNSLNSIIIQNALNASTPRYYTPMYYRYY